MLALRAGSELAGYRIEGVAGRGGMGTVYRATDIALDRPVALKLIADKFAGDPKFRERFRRESRLAASIRHPPCRDRVPGRRGRWAALHRDGLRRRGRPQHAAGR